MPPRGRKGGRPRDPLMAALAEDPEASTLPPSRLAALLKSEKLVSENGNVEDVAKQVKDARRNARRGRKTWSTFPSFSPSTAFEARLFVD